MLLPLLLCVLATKPWGFDSTVVNPFTKDRTTSPVKEEPLKTSKKVPIFANLEDAEADAKTAVGNMARDSGITIIGLSSRKTALAKDKPFSHQSRTYFGSRANFNEILDFLHSLETYPEPMAVLHMVLDAKKLPSNNQEKPKQFAGLFIIGSPVMITESHSQDEITIRQKGAITANSYIKLLDAFGRGLPKSSVLSDLVVKHKTSLTLGGHTTDLEALRGYLKEHPFLEKVIQPPTNPARERKGLFIFKATLREPAS